MEGREGRQEWIRQVTLIKDWRVEGGMGIDCRELSEGTPEGEEPSSRRGPQNRGARCTPQRPPRPPAYQNSSLFITSTKL